MYVTIKTLSYHHTLTASRSISEEMYKSTSIPNSLNTCIPVPASHNITSTISSLCNYLSQFHQTEQALWLAFSPRQVLVQWTLADPVFDSFIRLHGFHYTTQHVRIALRSHCWRVVSTCPASCLSCRADQVWSDHENTSNTPKSQPPALSSALPSHTNAQYIFHNTPYTVEIVN